MADAAVGTAARSEQADKGQGQNGVTGQDERKWWAFDAIAEEVGANTEQFQGCIAEQRPRPRVRSGILSGARLGVRGTPSFLINGIPLVGAQPLALDGRL